MESSYFQIDELDLEAELDALGNELEADVDTSYLDEALNAPGVPSKEPGYESKVSMELSLMDVSLASLDVHPLIKRRCRNFKCMNFFSKKKIFVTAAIYLC